MRTAFVFLTVFMLVVASVTASGPSSCKELYDKGKRISGAYNLKISSIPVYCHMGDRNFGCGTGGWTTVMKIDGTQQTFHYSASYWSTHASKYPQNGTTGFDDKETKLETYHKTSFTKICLGMKVESQTRFIVIELKEKANSLYELIADEIYRPTNLGRAKWKKLVGPQASMQNNCQREGFNAKGNKRFFYLSRARIGIIGNDQDNCDSPDSRIGFGTGGEGVLPSVCRENTCGNEASKPSSDNGKTSIKAMGYILVQ